MYNAYYSFLPNIHLKTNNMSRKRIQRKKDLTQTVNGRLRFEYYATFKPIGNPRFKEISRSDLDIALVWIKRQYKLLLEKRKEKLNAYMIDLYGHPVNFSEKSITKTINRVYEVLSETNTHLEDIRLDIWDYLGEKVELPLNSEKIVQAHKLILNNAPVEQVKQIICH